MRISVSSSGDTIFLPSLIAVTDEEQQNIDQGAQQNNPSIEPLPQGSPLSTAPVSTVLEVEQPHHVDKSVDPVTHTFAVCISLFKPTSISTIKVQLQAICSISWPHGLPCDHNIRTETFELGHLNWDLNLANYNYFIPVDSEDAIADDDSCIEIDPTKFMTPQRIPMKTFEHKPYDQITRGGYIHTKKENDPFVLGAVNGNAGSISYPPGHYVFSLPTQFEPQLPESLITLKSTVNYSLRTLVVPKSKAYILSEHDISVIRGPPVLGITTANKPIYINKVWNDALNYEISFPKKYVTIGEELPIKVKLMPLEKDINVRRIKVNVIEHTTYVSKNLEYEYEEERIEYDDGYYMAKRKEKSVPFFELKTRPKLTNAMRDEVVEGESDNLLNWCFHSNADDLGCTDMIGTLKIQAYLPFVKPHKALKQVINSNNKPMMTSVYHSDKLNRQINRELKTIVKCNDVRVNTTTRVLEHIEGFYPDSGNNRYIELDHKLQVSLRLSRLDPKDSKVHHYEVMIDTPIYLLNSLCTPENVELPQYPSGPNAELRLDFDSERLPTFEEAVSPMSSPILSPSGATHGTEVVNNLTRTSTLGTDLERYDTIDTTLMNDALSLSRPLSHTRYDILNSFRQRMGSTASGVSDHTGTTDDEDSQCGLPEEPPSYGDSQQLLSDTDEESMASLTSDHLDDETDLSEQFKIAAFRGVR